MPKDSVILKLDGNVTVTDFRTAVDGFVELMLALTAETNASAAVDWYVSDLAAGSASITTSGWFGNVEGEHTINIVVAKYEDLARSAEEGRIDRFSDRVRNAMRTITSVVNGHIPRVLMGTSEEPVIARIERRLADVPDDEGEPESNAEPPDPRPYSRTAIKGLIVTLDDKHGTYFTLQPAYAPRHIRCYPGPKHRGKLGTYWEERTWVIVEGTYLRYGDKPTLTDITDIVPLPNADKGGWRQAIGIAPRGPDAQDISSADAVRKVRDAEA